MICIHILFEITFNIVEHSIDSFSLPQQVKNWFHGSGQSRTDTKAYDTNSMFGQIFLFTPLFLIKYQNPGINDCLKHGKDI